VRQHSRPRSRARLRPHAYSRIIVWMKRSALLSVFGVLRLGKYLG
jgi:hypothetical protein